MCVIISTTTTDKFDLKIFPSNRLSVGYLTSFFDVLQVAP